MTTTYPEDSPRGGQMCEVCVSTFSRSRNYGTNLQAYALNEALLAVGAEGVSLLDSFRAPAFLLVHPTLLASRVQYKVGSRSRRQFLAPVKYEIPESRAMRLEEFRHEHFSYLNIDTDIKWRECVKAGMIFVAGGDIIWQPSLGYPNKYFLDFALRAGLPCFSYASSFGSQELPRKYHRAYRSYLGSYVSVGVRERSAAHMLAEIIDRHIEQVVDPTLLHGTPLWDDFAANARLSIHVNEGGYVLCYFVMDDPRYWAYVERLGVVTGLQIVVVPMHHRDEDMRYLEIEDATPTEFVWLIKNAAMVVTDSFHACAFCFTYEKEFYLLRRFRKAEDSKYDDFLGRYGLVKRVVADESRFVRIPARYTGDARARLAEDRERSLTYLRRALVVARDMR